MSSQKDLANGFASMAKRERNLCIVGRSKVKLRSAADTTENQPSGNFGHCLVVHLSLPHLLRRPKSFPCFVELRPAVFAGKNSHALQGMKRMKYAG
ncbi:MAG TPA: hypothetical protein DHW22_03290 [Planctomycetaceae bacterium]|nr:hypothetical protein [Planctomycetaceae bacterium]